MSEKNSSVYILKAIRPREAVDQLVYPNLEAEFMNHRPAEYDRLNTFWDTEDGSLSEQSKASTLAKYYLLATAQRLQNTADVEQQQLLTKRFTEASIEFYGAPDASEAKILVAGQCEQVQTWAELLPGDELCGELKMRYVDLASQVGQQENEQAIELAEIQEVAHGLGEYLKSQYADVLAVFETDDENRIIEPAEMAELFEHALEPLKVHDPRWQNWHVKLEAGKDTISVLPDQEAISVGLNRVPEKLITLKGVFGHEVLAHALRNLNGKEKDEKLGKGLPGYIDAEEGWGGFIEYAITGVIPPKIINRYTDISYALGQLDGTMHPRKELLELVTVRELVRSRVETGDYSEDRVVAAAITHTNRIYRGTLGNDIVGVFTKDIAYYSGYRKIASFFRESLKNGADVRSIFEYLSQGKFDPTNPEHLEYIEKLGA